MEVGNSLYAFLERVNPWWEMGTYRFDVYERNYYLRLIHQNKSRLIKILIGARRVGKTSILRSLINLYLEIAYSKEVIFLPGELPELRKRGIRSTLEMLEKKLEIDIFRDETYVFIDEVQEVDNWQQDVKLLYDNTRIRFFVSGSSSLILKKETSKLTGRFILLNVFPLSFREYLEFSDQQGKHEDDLLEEYLHFGGYPEYVLNKDPVYLQQAVESTLYRELLDYYGIRNPSRLTQLVAFLADKSGTPVSANRIATDLKIDDKTTKFYLEYLESVFLVYPVHRYGMSHRVSKSSLPKYYFNDTGILSIMGIRKRIGHLIENAVFLELMRREVFVEKPRIYYDLINGQEIDFRCREDLYEIKSQKARLEHELLRLEGIEETINVVMHNYSSVSNRDLLALRNVKYVDLKRFLMGEG